VNLGWKRGSAGLWKIQVHWIVSIFRLLDRRLYKLDQVRANNGADLYVSAPVTDQLLEEVSNLKRYYHRKHSGLADQPDDKDQVPAPGFTSSGLAAQSYQELPAQFTIGSPRGARD